MAFTYAPSDRVRAGISLIEVTVVLGIIAVGVGLAIPTSGRWLDNQRLRTSSQDVQAAFSYARGEAIRTGRLHIVFFDEDAGGSSLADANGDAVDILVIDDGRPGDTDQNCQVDDGEEALAFSLGEGVEFGVIAAGGTAPNDNGGGSIGNGATFEDAGGADATWVMFRPEGVPLAFSADCSMGDVGSGGGGVYLNNGDRDRAVVLTPLGTSHAHSWNGVSGSWSS